MPAQAQNGSNTGASGMETSDNGTFLFTSESVGEGHPGEKKKREKSEKRKMNILSTFVTILFVHRPAQAFLGALLQPLNLLIGVHF